MQAIAHGLFLWQCRAPVAGRGPRKTDWGKTPNRSPDPIAQSWRIAMIRSELVEALAQDNPELRAEEVEQVVHVFFDEIA